MDDPVLQILMDFANELEAASISLKQRIAEVASAGKTATVREEAFSILTYEKRTGDRLGEYEIAHKSANQGAKWNRAHQTLEASNASINNRYHPEGYVHCYWLYGQDRVHRQKLKQV